MEDELKAECPRCKAEFPLNMETTRAAHEPYSSMDLMVVIICPYCDKRYEI